MLICIYFWDWNKSLYWYYCQFLESLWTIANPSISKLILQSFCCQASNAKLLLPAFYCQASNAKLLLQSFYKPSFYCQASIASILLPTFQCPISRLTPPLCAQNVNLPNMSCKEPWDGTHHPSPTGYSPWRSLGDPTPGDSENMQRELSLPSTRMQYLLHTHQSCLQPRLQTFWKSTKTKL